MHFQPGLHSHTHSLFPSPSPLLQFREWGTLLLNWHESLTLPYSCSCFCVYSVWVLLKLCWNWLEQRVVLYNPYTSTLFFHSHLISSHLIISLVVASVEWTTTRNSISWISSTGSWFRQCFLHVTIPTTKLRKYLQKFGMKWAFLCLFITLWLFLFFLSTSWSGHFWYVEWHTQCWFVVKIIRIVVVDCQASSCTCNDSIHRLSQFHSTSTSTLTSYVVFKSSSISTLQITKTETEHWTNWPVVWTYGWMDGCRIVEGSVECIARSSVEWKRDSPHRPRTFCQKFLSALCESFQSIGLVV